MRSPADVFGRLTTTDLQRAHVVPCWPKQLLAIAALRALIDPIAALTTVVERAVGHDVRTVLLFGSIARGEATPNSDVDLAVLTASEWDGQVALEDAVRRQLGNACNVLAFTHVEFTELARNGEPVVSDILRHEVALIGASHPCVGVRPDGLPAPP